MIRNRTATFATAILCAAGARSACAQIAQGASKYLGNITVNRNILKDFGTYWNQITPENEGKWQYVEGLRDSMNWAGLDRISSYAKAQGIPWTFESLLWGASLPAWMSLPPDTLKVEMEEWFTLAGARYPEVATVVVVNEALPGHASAGLLSAALGGAGSSGYDWMIRAFQMARTAFPNAKLILNDYNTIEYGTDNAAFLKSVRALLAAKAPIDGIGTEAHESFRRPVDTLKKYLDSLAVTGLPIYITEFDIDASNDAKQDSIMEVQFPLFWNHPDVAGITYWGYIAGKTWRTGTGLKNQDGTERPALVWLKDYVAAHPNPPTPIHNTTGIVRNGTSQSGLGGRLEIRSSGGRLVLGIQRGHEFVAIGVAGRTRSIP